MTGAHYFHIILDDGAKIVIIGKGAFGNALAQSLVLATIPDTKTKNTTTSSAIPRIVQISAKDFLINERHGEDALAHQLCNASYVMYCGTNLTLHHSKIAAAMIKAKALSNSDSKALVGLPLLDFIDWSNPDPSNDETGDLMGAYKLSRAIHEEFCVWKAVGVSNFDIAGQDVRSS